MPSPAAYFSLAALLGAAAVVASPVPAYIVETQYDIVYETVIVTANGAAPTVEATPSSVFTPAPSSVFTPAPSSVFTPAPSSVFTPAPSSSPAPVNFAAFWSHFHTPKPKTSQAPVSTPPPFTPAPITSTEEATPIAPSPAPVASSSTPAPANDYQSLVLAHHNVHRSNHSAPDLVWSDKLAQIAADEAAVCIYAHNVTGGGGGYGQNIAAGIAPSDIGVVISDLFYNGEVNWYNGLYGLANPSFDSFEHWGHMSQVVWKGTGSVGCATHDCSAGGLGSVGSNVPAYFTVCNYDAPGNMGGGYGDNVGEPLGRATVTGDQAL